MPPTDSRALDSATQAGHPAVFTALIDIAREVESLKRECGTDPESSIAVRNSRYMGISYKLRALASALSAAPQSDGWRPIAEAPKDGSEIDVWLVTGREPDVFWGTPKLGHKVPCWCRHVYDSYFGWIPESVGEPSHFMDLPTPPKMTEGQSHGE